MRMPEAMPPPRRIQEALRKTTEALAAELARPGSPTPDWSDFEWQIARAVLATHGVAPLLASRLRWQVPADWRRFLDQQREHTIIRHERIDALLSRIDAHSRAQGLPVVALKGAALHALGLYRRGERPMADLDLLVRPADADRAGSMLAGVGYHESHVTPKHRVFAARGSVVRTPDDVGEHPDNPLMIELHEYVREWLPLHPQDISSRVWPQQSRPGLNAYPRRAALMAHVLLHAAGAVVYRCVRLLHLNDLALLSTSMNEADWNELCGQDPRIQWWALPPLLLTARYYESAVPRPVLERLAAHCPRRLLRATRRQILSDVSLSNLRIEAFPGIEWAQSASERMRYVITRIRPNRATLALREVVRSQSYSSGSSWARLSQGHRILRWLLTRPTRSESMYPVHMVLTRAR